MPTYCVVCLNLTWCSLLDTYKYICTPWSCLLNLVSPQLRVVTVLLQVAQWKQTVVPSIYCDSQLCWWRKRRKKCRKLLSPTPSHLTHHYLSTSVILSTTHHCILSLFPDIPLLFLEHHSMSPLPQVTDQHQLYWVLITDSFFISIYSQ
jgi:hypothetical protein